MICPNFNVSLQLIKNNKKFFIKNQPYLDAMKISNIAVYAASSTKVNPIYLQEAYHLGEILAENDIHLVYGAGAVGLMGSIADGVLEHGGTVTGVIPQFMVDQGWCREGLTKCIVTNSMHERKATIEHMVDAMVALPGGIGTFEELLECLTWKQLGLHTKPIIILNTNHYYDNLLECLNQMTEEHFMREIHGREKMFCVVEKAEEVLPAIYNAPKWDSTIRKAAQL